MTPMRTTYLLGAVVVATMAAMYLLAFVLGAEPLPLAAVFAVAVFAAFGAVITLRTSLPVPRPRVREVVVALGATSITLFMAREMEIPQLVAAAFVATSLGVMALPGGPLDAIAAGAGYAGSFVGLLTPAITLSWYWVLVAGGLAGLLWTLIGPAVMDGVGGRMGVVGFMASSAIYAVASLTGEEHNAVLLPAVNGMAHAAVIPIGAFAALITWTLMNRAAWGFNLASGLPSLVVCGVVAMADMGATGTVLATAWFGGTFVGGTSLRRLPSAAWLGFAGALYGAFMLHFEGPLQGHVGVIGVTGTISCLAVIAVERLIRPDALPALLPARLSGQSGVPQ